MPAWPSLIFLTAKDLNKYFSKEAQIAKDKMRRCLTTLVVIVKKIMKHYTIMSIIQVKIKLPTVCQLLCQVM